MEMTFIIFGVFFIGMGMLVGRFPNLISGINTMSEEKKRNIDLPAIGNVHKKGMIIIGVINLLLATPLFSSMQFSTRTIISLIVIIIGVLIATTIAQKYDKNKKSRLEKILVPVILISVPVILISITVIASLFIWRNSTPTAVNITDEKIEFTGSYGITINFSEIEKVELWEKMPKILRRTNGLSLGDIKKGHFKVDSIGKCRLFLDSAEEPFLYIKHMNDDQIIYNSKNPQQTEDLYLRLNVEEL
ncbi:MAG: DUF3784 domain-containing protein [bacterium]